LVKQSVIECLDRLENLIETSSRIPIVGKRIVDRIEVLELIDQIRIALPEEIRQAELLLAERKNIVTEAKREAEVIRDHATEERAKLAAESDIVALARDQAEKLLQEARRDAAEVKAGADDYAESTLTSLEETLQRTARVVRKGIEELRRRKVSS
jgi:cell division septum initiation protein DivIVA